MGSDKKRDGKELVDSYLRGRKGKCRIMAFFYEKNAAQFFYCANLSKIQEQKPPPIVLWETGNWRLDLLPNSNYLFGAALRPQTVDLFVQRRRRTRG